MKNFPLKKEKKSEPLTKPHNNHMRYLPLLLAMLLHILLQFLVPIWYIMCVCVYIDFFLVVTLARQLPNEQQIHSSAFLVLSLPPLSLPLCLSLNYQKSGSTVNQFSGIIATTDVRDFRQQREGGEGEKKETAIITRATGKSENKTCHKINKAKKKLNRKNFKCKMHSKFEELLQCAIKVHARRVLALWVSRAL